MLQAAEIFQDGMILQRKKEVKIWGKSGAGDVITAEIQGKKEERRQMKTETGA